MNSRILDFYKQTSLYTDLGLYKEFAKQLTNDIDELCVLQRMQIIHPFAYSDLDIRKQSKCFWGDMTKVQITRLDYEDDLFPTASSMLHELLRKNKYKTEEIYYSTDPPTLGLKASIRGLVYDFHSLMNDEIIFLHLPKYIQDKKFELSEEEYMELDKLAELLLEPDENFDKILDIWNKEPKFRIMSGALN